MPANVKAHLPPGLAILGLFAEAINLYFAADVCRRRRSGGAGVRCKELRFNLAISYSHQLHVGLNDRSILVVQ